MPVSNTKLFLPTQGTLTADTAGIPIASIGGRGSRPGIFAAWGTFGGGTIKLQVGFSIDGTNYQWFDTGASLAAAGYTNFNVAGDLLRIVLTGSTNPSLNYRVM